MTRNVIKCWEKTPKQFHGQDSKSFATSSRKRKLPVLHRPPGDYS